jgi:predicted phosphoadenosine phosphosulfate sulfurtransferase
MALPELIEATIARTERCLEGYKDGALMLSFGKDSMVLLDLFKHWKLPAVVFIPAVYEAHQWEHAANVILDMGLKVHAVRPSCATVRTEGDSLALQTFYPVTAGVTLAWLQRMEKSINGCMVDEAAAVSPYEAELPFDVMLCGQKEGDPNFLGGSCKVPDYLSHQPVGPDFIYPLRDWTDADIWQYIKANKVPVDASRYDLTTGLEAEGTKHSNDRVDRCAACLDPRRGAEVYCPKARANIPSRVKAAAPTN